MKRHYIALVVLAICLPAFAAHADVVINEFMAANGSTATNALGDSCFFTFAVCFEFNNAGAY